MRRHPLRGDGDACASPAGTPAGTRAVAIVAITCPYGKAENPPACSIDKKCRVPSAEKVEGARTTVRSHRRGRLPEVVHRWGERICMSSIALGRVDRESSRFHIWEPVISGPLTWHVRIRVLSCGPPGGVSFARVKFRELELSSVRSRVIACRPNIVNCFVCCIWFRLVQYSVIAFMFFAYDLEVNCKILMSRMRDLRPKCTNLRNFF